MKHINGDVCQSLSEFGSLEYSTVYADPPWAESGGGLSTREVPTVTTA